VCVYVCVHVATLQQSDSDINTRPMEPVTSLRTSAGKVTFFDLVLPAALPCDQPADLDNAGTNVRHAMLLFSELYILRTVSSVC